METKNLKNLRWTPVGIFVFVFHVMALVGLPLYFYYFSPAWSMVLAMIILFSLTGLGITAGYHRLYAHRAYNLKKPVEAIVLFFATMAIQGPVLKWSYDHRMHHANTDKVGDPYNVTKGFWYAHILWMFDSTRDINKKIVPDLYKNKLVMFQYRHYITLAVVTNVAVCLAIGWLLGDYLGAFILCWGVRLLFTYHMTWFINSLAHYWGEKSYSKELSARDNAILALLTLGEGYHNYHHTFPADYRNGARFYHFDPSKWIIWALHKFGLASELRRFHRDNITDKLIYIDRSLLLRRVSVLAKNPKQLKRILLQRAMKTKSALEAHIHTLAESLRNKRLKTAQLLDEYRVLRRSRTDRLKRKAIKMRIKKYRKAYAAEWKSWCDLCALILKSKNFSH